MVSLRELFSMLATGEFSNISLSRNTTGSISESEYPKIIGHINLGLIEIYKRLRLMENEVTLHAVPEVSDYYLREDRIASLAQISQTRYIERPANYDGFLNIIEITKVFDTLGNELTLNNRFVTPAIIQTSTDSLKITKLEEAQTFQIVYQAYPNKIVLDSSFDPEDYILQIPTTILEALLFYIAYRVYKPTGANNSTVNADKSASYQQQYELSCQKLELYGLGIQDCDQDNTFETKGWV